MKIRSWSKPHTVQYTLHMLSVDHLNTDRLPLSVKCKKKFASALDREVTYRDVCVCVYIMREERTSCMFCACQEQTSDQEWTHLISTVGFGFSFRLILENLRIELEIMGWPASDLSIENISQIIYT